MNESFSIRLIWHRRMKYSARVPNMSPKKTGSPGVAQQVQYRLGVRQVDELRPLAGAVHHDAPDIDVVRVAGVAGSHGLFGQPGLQRVDARELVRVESHIGGKHHGSHFPELRGVVRHAALVATEMQFGRFHAFLPVVSPEIRYAKNASIS